MFDHAVFCETAEELLSTLDRRSPRVLRLRFGLEDGSTKTFEEIGEMFGLARERIRPIERVALKHRRTTSGRDDEAGATKVGIAIAV